MRATDEELGEEKDNAPDGNEYNQGPVADVKCSSLSFSLKDPAEEEQNRQFDEADRDSMAVPESPFELRSRCQWHRLSSVDGERTLLSLVYSLLVSGIE